jgi:hypothetical protein
VTSVDDLKGKVLTWLRSQGYPLEMRVAKAFQEHRLSVVQSDYYKSPSSGDSREIDLLASVQASTDKALIRATIVCECKSSKDKPWIFFRSRDSQLAAPARVAQRPGSHIARQYLFDLCELQDVQDLSLFHVGERPSYAFTQAFTSGTDTCYAAACSVAEATKALTETASQLSSPLVCEFLFPLIVTEARMYAVELDNSSDLSIEEITSEVLVWRNQLAGPPHTIIHVVHAEALGDFAAAASEAMHSLVDLVVSRYCR